MFGVVRCVRVLVWGRVSPLALSASLSCWGVPSRVRLVRSSGALRFRLVVPRSSLPLVRSLLRALGCSFAFSGAFWCLRWRVNKC